VPTVADGADRLGLRICGVGLSPPTPSSVEPIGMPMRPRANGKAIPVGEEADAAGGPDVPLVMLAHVPEAVPALPPPSNSVDDADAPGVDSPVPVELPVVGLAPDRFPAVELMPAQVAVLSAVGPSGETPDVIGLTPGELSSVAPRGIPVPGIAGAGPMPSGEVIPSGDGADGTAPICAEAEALPMRTMAIVAANRRIIAGPSLACLRSQAR